MAARRTERSLRGAAFSQECFHEIGTSRRLSPQQVMSELIDEAKGTSSASTACPHDMDEELDHQEIAELVGGWTTPRRRKS